MKDLNLPPPIVPIALPFHISPELCRDPAALSEHIFLQWTQTANWHEPSMVMLSQARREDLCLRMNRWFLRFSNHLNEAFRRRMGDSIHRLEYWLESADTAPSPSSQENPPEVDGA